MTDSKAGILLAEDNHDVAELLRMMIDAEADLRCVGVVHHSDEVSAAAQRHRPAVIVFDLSMPGRGTLAVIKELTSTMPQVRSIIFSGHSDADSIDQAAAAGAWGFVSKHEGFERILDAIRRVLKGETALA